MTGRILTAAVLVVAMLSGCRSTSQQVGGLDSPSADVRRESANELRTMRVADAEHRKQVVHRLSVMAQSDPEPLVRSAALLAITTQDAAAALDIARRLRADADAMVRWDAVKVMAGANDATLIDPLVEVAAKDTSEEVRREAVRALARYDDPRVIDILIARLNDESVSVAHAARASLTEIAGGIDLGMSPDAWRKWWENEKQPEPSS